MIVADRDDIPTADARRLEALFIHDGFEVLLRSMKASEASLKVEAMLEIDRVAGDIQRGGSIPDSAMSKLRRASAYTIAIKILTEMASDKFPHSQVKLLIQ